MAVPDNPSGLVFVRRQDTVVHLDEKGQAQYTGFWIRVLHANALQLGNLAVSWNPGSGRPVIHAINVHRDGKTIAVLPNASFEILRREDQLEAAQLNGILTAVLKVPDLRVGDEIEFSFTTRLDDPTLGSSDAGFLHLASDPPPGRYHLELNWNPGQKPAMKMTPEMAAVMRESPGGIVFRFDNPAVMSPPTDAPARFQLGRFAEYSDFRDWREISRKFAPLYQQAAKISDRSSLKQEVAKIKSRTTSPFERMSAALQLVQQDVRYVYVGLDGGNYRPASADETWQLRYGDCKGKTALLLGLLSELGIAAEPVLANNSGGDDGLEERLPNPQMFDHVLVRALIDGKPYYLDGTLPPAAAPSPEPVLPYRWLLPLGGDGRPIERVAWKPAAVPEQINLFEIDARAGFDEAAKITSTTIVRGIKGSQQQAQYSALTADQILNAFRQHATGDTWQTIDEVRWSYDAAAAASVLTIVGKGAIDWDDDGDGRRSLALAGGGFSPPKRRVRTTGQNQTLPYANQPEFACHVTTLRMPGGTTPKQWSHKSSYSQRMFGQAYSRALAIDGGAIRMIRSFRTEAEEITADQAKRDNARIASFDNSMAWVFYDPQDDAKAIDNQKRVPATYEIDWASDSSACLPVATDE